MIAVPSIFALGGARRSASVLLVFIFIFYWVMIGFRFRVGMDWDNYLYIYAVTHNQSAIDLIFERESAFKLLMWLAEQLGGGMILVNAISSLVFCCGFFAVASRCREPFIAVVVATPLLVIAFAMSGTRQAMAIGIIFYLFATWDRRTTFRRIAFVFVATLFHFSAVFVLIFVALAAKAPFASRLAAAVFLSAVIGLIIYFFALESVSTYKETYVSGPRRLSAPGALVQVGALATAALVYLGCRKQWVQVNAEHALYHNLAISALIAVPAIYISSVGAYRFALYFWPMAMYVWSGVPAMIDQTAGRSLYRLTVISCSVALLILWLTLANNSVAWLPYQSWLLQPNAVSLRR